MSQSDRMRARWADPAFRAKQDAARRTPEYRASYTNRRRPRPAPEPALKPAPSDGVRLGAADAASSLIADIRTLVAARDAEIERLRAIIRELTHKEQPR